MAMTRMDAAMTRADGGLVGDPDRDFIALMIPHHQGATWSFTGPIPRSSRHDTAARGLDSILQSPVATALN